MANILVVNDERLVCDLLRAVLGLEGGGYCDGS